MATGDKHVAVLEDRRQRVLRGLGDERRGPNESPRLHVHTHHRLLSHGDQLSHVTVRHDDGGAVSRRVLDLSIGPQGLSRPFIQGHDTALRTTGHAQDLAAIDNHVLGESPDAILRIELGFEIHVPQLLARPGVVGRQPAGGIHMIQTAIVVRRRRARPRARSAPGSAVGRFP